MQARAFLRQIQWFALAATTLVLGAWLLGGSALAGRPRAISQTSSPQPPQRTTHALTNDAYLEFVPGDPGNCPAPPNGGTTYVGCRFVLDLILDAGSNHAPYGVTAQQSYLKFTYELIQNARVTAIGTSCVPTNTVTGDLTVLDAILQNEVCNGPGACVFRGIVNQPGWWAFASGALSNCPEGCPDDTFPDPRWRVAQTGWCASAPGQARLHWQFSPPTRDTQIVLPDVTNPALFEDYVFNIVVPSTGTPISTPTPCTPNYTYANVTAAIVSGVTDTGNHCDDCSTAITLPFPFQLYDQIFTTASVHSNGSLILGAGNFFMFQCPPTDSLSYVIGPYADDLVTFGGGSGCAIYPNGDCGIYTSVSGTAPNRVFNIEWRTVHIAVQFDRFNFEIRLYENSPEQQFDFVYGRIDSPFNFGTGVAKNNGVYTCYPESINEGLKIVWTLPSCGTPTLTPTPCPTCPTNTPTHTNTLIPTYTPTYTLTPTPTPSNCGAGWATGPSLPTTQVRAVGVWFPRTNRFYIMGGRTSDTAGSDLLNPRYYDPTSNSWTIAASAFPDNQVSNMVCANLNGPNGFQIYCVGGNSAGGYPTSAVREYDPVADTFTTLIADPYARDALTGTLPGGFAVHNSKMYVFGGFNPTTTTMTNQIWMFDPQAATGSKWTRKNAVIPDANANTTGMSYIPAATIGNFIYGAGGSGFSGVNLVDAAVTFRYDPIGDVVSDGAVPDLPAFGSGETRAVNYNSKVTLMGGGRTAPNPSSTIWQFDPANVGAGWVTVGCFPGPRRNSALDINPATNKIFIAGGYMPDAPTDNMQISGAIITPTVTNTPTSTPNATPSNGAYLEFVPGAPGNCPAPPNGGATTVGCRFVLDMMLDAGVNFVTAQQSYLTFTHSIIQNARVSDIGSSCTLTNTLTPDVGTFEAVLMNEVCNGPNPCVFRGQQVATGSIAYASGGLINCDVGCTGRFRVAAMGVCATAPGQAVLHWLFSPPAPPNQDTQIIDAFGEIVSNRALFHDYVFNVLPATGTPTPIPTRTIRGHVTWDGRYEQPDPSQMLPISLTLRPKSGGPYIDFPMQNTDENGYFTVDATNLQTGEYYWRVKGPKYLANSGVLTLAGDPVTNVEMGLMLTGDADGNNAVNISDFNIMKGTFGWSCAEGGYDDRAEFTGDCRVSVVDFLRLKLNFGATGAPQIRPPGGP